MTFKFREIYGVSEKTGMTKCELQMNDAWKARAIASFLRNVLRESNPKYMTDPLPPALYVPTSFIAYAKCAEEDTFSRTVGRKVARDKAYAKYAKWAEKFIKTVRQYSKEISETMNINGETFED